LNAIHDSFAVNERRLRVNNARSTENPRGFFVNRELLIVSHVFFTVNPARSSLVVAFTTVMIAGFKDKKRRLSDKRDRFSHRNSGFKANRHGFNDKNAGFNENHPGLSDNQRGFGEKQRRFKKRQPGFKERTHFYSGMHRSMNEDMAPECRPRPGGEAQPLRSLIDQRESR
jgi:hypothetical protein